jgi:hypothetical protein
MELVTIHHSIIQTKFVHWQDLEIALMGEFDFLLNLLMSNGSTLEIVDLGKQANHFGENSLWHENHRNNTHLYFLIRNYFLFLQSTLE